MPAADHHHHHHHRQWGRCHSLPHTSKSLVLIDKPVETPCMHVLAFERFRLRDCVPRRESSECACTQHSKARTCSSRGERRGRWKNDPSRNCRSSLPGTSALVGACILGCRERLRGLFIVHLSVFGTQAVAPMGGGAAKSMGVWPAQSLSATKASEMASEFIAHDRSRSSASIRSATVSSWALAGRSSTSGLPGPHLRCKASRLTALSRARQDTKITSISTSGSRKLARIERIANSVSGA